MFIMSEKRTCISVRISLNILVMTFTVAVQSDTQTKLVENRTEITINGTSGATVVLHCAPKYGRAIWKGPRGMTTTANDTLKLYTDGININPMLNKSNIRLIGLKNGYYNLEIAQFSIKDEGTYRCSVLQNSTTYSYIYHALFVGKSEFPESTTLFEGATTEFVENATLFERAVHVTTIQRKNKKVVVVSIILVVLTIVGCLLLLVACRNVLRAQKRRTRDLHQDPESLSQFVEAGSVENRSYQPVELSSENSTTDVTNQAHQRHFPVQPIGSSILPQDQAMCNTTFAMHSRMTEDDSERTKNRKSKKKTLNYAEISFPPEEPEKPLCIRGIENKTIYSEIDITLKADPLPESSSEEDSQDDDSSDFMSIPDITNYIGFQRNSDCSRESENNIEL